MSPDKAEKVARLLRELAELFQSEAPEPRKDYYIPPIQVGGCNCSQHQHGTLTGGWLCPVHGRQL